MTGDEHQPQQIVLDELIRHSVELPRRHGLLRGELAPKLGVFAVEPLVAAEQVDGAALGDGHEPGARIVRHA